MTYSLLYKLHSIISKLNDIYDRLREIKILFQSKKKEENEDCRPTLRPQVRHPQTLFYFSTRTP